MDKQIQRIITIFIVCALVLFLFSGCQSSENTETVDGEEFNVVYSIKDATYNNESSSIRDSLMGLRISSEDKGYVVDKVLYNSDFTKYIIYYQEQNLVTVLLTNGSRVETLYIFSTDEDYNYEYYYDVVDEGLVMPDNYNMDTYTNDDGEFVIELNVF